MITTERILIITVKFLLWSAIWLIGLGFTYFCFSLRSYKRGITEIPENMARATFWPITLPILIVCSVINLYKYLYGLEITIDEVDHGYLNKLFFKKKIFRKEYIIVEKCQSIVLIKQDEILLKTNNKKKAYANWTAIKI